MGKCPNCGAEVDEADAFCQQCGATLGQSLGDGTAGQSPPQQRDDPRPAQGRQRGPRRDRDRRQPGREQRPREQQSPDTQRRTALKVGGGLVVLGAVGAGVLFVRDAGEDGTDIPPPGGTAEVADTPRVSFDATFELGAGGATATVTHTAGDELDPGQTHFEVEGESSRRVDWTALTNANALGPGDALVVEIRESEYGGRLLIVWENDDTSMILDDFSIPASG
jgi:hypothetical protein